MECPVGLRQMINNAHFNEGNVGAIWTVRRKIELWSYVVSFEFSRPKSSSSIVATESYIIHKTN